MSSRDPIPAAYQPTAPRQGDLGDKTEPFVSTNANTIEPSERPEPRWGFWATTGFSLVVLGTFLILQTVAAILFMVVHIGVSGQAFDLADAESLTSNGLLISIATLVSMPPCAALVALFAKLKRGATLRGYLGLRTFSVRQGLTWLGATVVYVAVCDGLTYVVGRPVVPEFVANAYESAVVLPVLWIALVVAAPLFEEVFFRGFMLEGFRYTRLGPWGAILLTSLVWSAIHVQYDAFQIGGIFLGGLLLGAARIRTGSVFLTMAMHALQNVIATVEAAVYVHLQQAAGG
ncbi:MAG TPA: CPBP family intramembrane glutamic endopeptidase [Pirellulales bacterium]|nr:CPBP family intramembrane glutamic endopeptidase [Pirellulales bacterium]